MIALGVLLALKVPGVIPSGMDFVCLAAGQGSRMGRLGVYLQKCMYPVGLEPFLEHTLRQLLRSGLVSGRSPGRLVLVVGHLREQVRDYFGDRFEELEIEYVEQARRLGTGHALDLARQWLRPRGSVIAWQADLFVTAQMFRRVAATPAENAVTLGPGQAGESPVLRATVEGELVTRVWEGEGPLYDVGLWKLSPEVLAAIGRDTAPGGEVRMLPNLQRCIEAGSRVGFAKADDWIHLGGTLPTAEENVRQVVNKVREHRLSGEH